MQTFGSRLKAIRSELGLSQREMVAKLDVSLGTWQAWETGRYPPNVEALARLCATGFNGHWLLTGEGDRRAGPTQKDSPPAITSGPPRSRDVEPSGLEGLTAQALEELQAEGLARLWLLSRRGSQSGVWAVLRVLVEAGTPLGLEEIATEVRKADPAVQLIDVSADVEVGALVGLAEIDRRDGVVRARALPGARLVSTQAVDSLQAAREAIRALAVEIAPRCRPGDRRAWLGRGVITTDRPVELVEEVRRRLLSLAEDWDSDAPGAVPVQIVGAVSAEE